VISATPPRRPERPWRATNALVKGRDRLLAPHGAAIIAEGVETADELTVLRQLGIRYGQGYYLGRPAPRSALRALNVGQAVTGLSSRPT